MNIIKISIIAMIAAPTYAMIPSQKSAFAPSPCCAATVLKMEKEIDEYLSNAQKTIHDLGSQLYQQLAILEMQAKLTEDRPIDERANLIESCSFFKGELQACFINIVQSQISLMDLDSSDYSIECTELRIENIFEQLNIIIPHYLEALCKKTKEMNKALAQCSKNLPETENKRLNDETQSLQGILKESGELLLVFDQK